MLTVHSLRAGYATRIEAVSGLGAAATALGHSDPRSTLRYVAGSAGSLRSAVERAFA